MTQGHRGKTKKIISVVFVIVANMITTFAMAGSDYQAFKPKFKSVSVVSVLYC